MQLINEQTTLCAALTDPAISQIAPYAIKDHDLTTDPVWLKTFAQLKEEHFGGDMLRGFHRLFRAAETGSYYHLIYPEPDRVADAEKEGVNLVWFPSDDPAADERPYILLVPGGGFVNVWNLTEGWPIGDHINEKGYHVFILTYRVGGENRVIPGEMDDIAQAIRYIREHSELFHVQWDRYITCGFSAGGYLISLWSTTKHGYAAHDLPKPQAMFPVYPFVSWVLAHRDGDFDPQAVGLLGCPSDQAAANGFEVPLETNGFPPCAIFLAAQDELVPPEHSHMLHRSLTANGIPCKLQIGPQGGHGFADGSGMCMAGWPERAIEWYESL